MRWRDGRAAQGACLENMFGSHQRGFESHSLRLRLTIDVFGFTIGAAVVDCQSKIDDQDGEVPEWLNGLAC